MTPAANVGGMVVLGQYLRAALSRLRIVRPPAEATLVSFPKSGRTWLRVMLDRAGLSVHYIHGGSSHARAAHHEELGVDGSELLGAAVLFLHRDPRDTVVSGYFQKTLRVGGGCGMTLPDFIRDPRFGLEKAMRFNLGWLEEGDRFKGFASVSYEELRADPVRGLGLVIGHLRPGASPGPDLLGRIVEASSFQRMREQEARGELARRYGEILQPSDVRNPDSFKVRRGKIGGYVDYLSPADMAWADALLTRHDYFRRVSAAAARHGLLRARG